MKHLGDVTEVCSRTENLKHLCLVQPSRHALLISVTPFGIFMSNSSLMGSLVSGVKDTWSVTCWLSQDTIGVRIPPVTPRW